MFVLSEKIMFFTLCCNGSFEAYEKLESSFKLLYKLENDILIVVEHTDKSLKEGRGLDERKSCFKL